jgi:hypothetical protein
MLTIERAVAVALAKTAMELEGGRRLVEWVAKVGDRP